MAFNVAFECSEGLAPVPIEVRAQGVERVGVERVHPPTSFGAVHDEAGVFEDAEMLRNCRSAHRKVASQLTDRQRAVGEPRDDRAPGRVAERVELGIVVSSHLR